MPFPKGRVKFHDNEFRWDEGMTVRDSFRDFSKKIGLFKPSIFVGQAIVSCKIHSMWSEKFHGPMKKGYILSGDHLRMMGRVFDFLKNCYLYRDDDGIPFGEIGLEDARRFYELVLQVLSVQKRDYVPICDDIPDFMKVVANSTEEIARNYREFYRSQRPGRG